MAAAEDLPIPHVLYPSPPRFEKPAADDLANRRQISVFAEPAKQ